MEQSPNFQVPPTLQICSHRRAQVQKWPDCGLRGRDYFLQPLEENPRWVFPAIAIPNFVKARAASQQNACINNLRQLDAAKEQWALEQGKKSGDVPTKEDLLPYLRKWPVCPQGGIYTIGPVGEPPTCSIPGHKLH